MIRLLVLDVDGTMTDGGVYYDASGSQIKVNPGKTFISVLPSDQANLTRIL